MFGYTMNNWTLLRCNQNYRGSVCYCKLWLGTSAQDIYLEQLVSLALLSAARIVQMHV